MDISGSGCGTDQVAIPVKDPFHILGTRKVIRVYQGRCDICDKNRLCLSTDSSDWEYEDVLMCYPCIRAFFQAYG